MLCGSLTPFQEWPFSNYIKGPKINNLYVDASQLIYSQILK